MVTKVGTHPQFGWDYSYIILQGIPAEARILRTNAQDANLVADHMMATAPGTRPACSQETVRQALTAQFTLMSVRMQPLFDTYRQQALQWATQLCLAHAMTLEQI